MTLAMTVSIRMMWICSLTGLRQENQDVWAYVHTYRDRDILVLGRRIYEQYSESRVIGYTLISIDEKIFSKTVLEPVGLAVLLILCI